MCGIAGYLALNEAHATAADVVARLNDRQARRGPDGDGLWRDETRRVVLGHRRLAIIDVSDSGAQPMRDDTGRYVITFNGEIYNHAELRQELQALGRVFATQSDTEVIIQAIAQWGEASLNRLRGMYAFALWDEQEQELWLARDPFGIKPLYVAERDGHVWFASQARALADVAPIDASRDAAALVGFYMWGHVPEPFTWWAGVRMFPAGCVQRIRRGAPMTSPRTYCDLAAQFAGSGAALPPEKLESALNDSVRAHLVADVPVGVFLSAGVDSGVLASLAARQTTDLHTVTLGFEEYRGGADDEASAAEDLARKLGSRHATVWIDRLEFEAVVDDFLSSMDQPSIDGLNSYLVSRAAAAQGLKVMLSGVGADEIFGGYPSFAQIPKLVALGARTPFRRQIGGLLARLAPLAPRRLPPKLAGVLAHAGSIEDAYLLRRALHLAGELDALLDESWIHAGLSRLRDAEATRASGRKGLCAHAQIILLESEIYMRRQLLRDTDWASMAHGLEVRTPYVDMPLFAAVAGAVAARQPPSKADLAAAGGVGYLARRPKTGFTTPVSDWIGARSARGLRGWASNVHRAFRVAPRA